MDTRTNRTANNTRFAVIRCYQPARIEHELLAQVFDLAGRVSDGRCELVEDDHELTDMAIEGFPNVGCVASLFDCNSQSPIATLEDAA